MTEESADAKDPFEPKKEGMDRRQFVKTAMGVAAVGALGAAGAGLVVPLSTAGGLKFKRFPYIGAKKIGGPAPQGIPMIPVKVNADGFVEGVPEAKSPDIAHSLEWYAYCSHDAAPGLKPGFTQDNILRYFNNPAKVAVAAKELGEKLWYADKLDQKIHVDHFDEVGKGAPFRWRSEGETDNNIITGIVIRVDPSQVKGKVPEGFIDHDLIAFCSFCAHFCCVPGYKESQIPKKAGLFEKIYCTCHDSVYDPWELKEYRFPPNL